MEVRPQKGWYHRKYLPHLDVAGKIQAITFRLADSVPIELIKRWRHELQSPALEETAIQLKRMIAKYEDMGHGSCLLARPTYAEIVENALLHFDGDRYQLFEWVIMPNHVHAMIKADGDRLDRIVKSWKSYTASIINEAENTSGRFWARDYHDRYIRDESHYLRSKHYIRMNPVMAGLCHNPEDWEFGSASMERRFSDRPG